MRAMKMHGWNRLAMLGLVVGVTTGLAVNGAAQTIGGQAYGAYASTPLSSLSQSPLAVLPATSGTDGNIATAEANALNVPNVLSSAFLNSTATGALGTTSASAQSIATLADVNVLNGLITAAGLIATVTSTRTASGALSDANGTTFDHLTVAGVPVTSGDAPVAPNTNMSLPGVGYVVLNEQLPTGDGVTSSGLTVNMIHVYLTNLLGMPVGQIIVGSATSAIGS